MQQYPKLKLKDWAWMYEGEKEASEWHDKSTASTYTFWIHYQGANGSSGDMVANCLGEEWLYGKFVSNYVTIHHMRTLHMCFYGKLIGGRQLYGKAEIE